MIAERDARFRSLDALDAVPSGENPYSVFVEGRTPERGTPYGLVFIRHL